MASAPRFSARTAFALLPPLLPVFLLADLPGIFALPDLML
jgi:hypothetical protein